MEAANMERFASNSKFSTAAARIYLSTVNIEMKYIEYTHVCAYGRKEKAMCACV